MVPSEMAPVQQRPHVVLCEASDALREAMELIFSDQFRVTSMSFIEEMAPILNSTIPRLLIIDVDDQHVPYKDVLQRVSRISKTVPILLVSRDFNLENQQKAIKRLGNVSFIRKPFDTLLFLEKVKTLIRGYSELSGQRHVIRISQ